MNIETRFMFVVNNTPMGTVIKLCRKGKAGEVFDSSTIYYGDLLSPLETAKKIEEFLGFLSSDKIEVEVVSTNVSSEKISLGGLMSKAIGGRGK